MKPALLWWLLVMAMAPCALGAQQNPSQAVEEYRQIYLDARQVYETAVGDRDILKATHDDLIRQRNLAVQRGDGERADQLSAEIQEKADELDSADAELRMLLQVWVDAWEVLTGRIDSYRLLLTQQLEARPADSEDDEFYRQLEARFDSLTSLRDSVDAAIPRVPVEVPAMPNIQALPTDSPAALRRKAGIYEDYASVCERRLSRVNDQIDKLNNDRRINEAKAGSDRRRDRFGTRTVQVGQTGAGSGRAAGDTAVVDLSQQTLEQRIEALEELREELSSKRDEALARARELRRPVGGSR